MLPLAWGLSSVLFHRRAAGWAAWLGATASVELRSLNCSGCSLVSVQPCCDLGVWLKGWEVWPAPLYTVKIQGVLCAAAAALLLETLTCCNFLVHITRTLKVAPLQLSCWLMLWRSLHIECCIVASVWNDGMPNHPKYSSFFVVELFYCIQYEFKKMFTFCVSSDCGSFKWLQKQLQSEKFSDTFSWRGALMYLLQEKNVEMHHKNHNFLLLPPALCQVSHF